MKPNVSSLERAFELAASGRYPTVTDVCNKLGAEGYHAAQVSGPLLRKQLFAVITKANGNAVKVMRGPRARTLTRTTVGDGKDAAAVSHGKRGGKAEALNKKARTKIAEKAAAARWNLASLLPEESEVVRQSRCLELPDTDNL